jgi:hypothetical protein
VIAEHVSFLPCKMEQKDSLESGIRHYKAYLTIPFLTLLVAL